MPPKKGKKGRKPKAKQVKLPNVVQKPKAGSTSPRNRVDDVAIQSVLAIISEGGSSEPVPCARSSSRLQGKRKANENVGAAEDKLGGQPPKSKKPRGRKKKVEPNVALPELDGASVLCIKEDESKGNPGLESSTSAADENLFDEVVRVTPSTAAASVVEETQGKEEETVEKKVEADHPYLLKNKPIEVLEKELMHSENVPLATEFISRYIMMKPEHLDSIAAHPSYAIFKASIVAGDQCATERDILLEQVNKLTIQQNHLLGTVQKLQLSEKHAVETAALVTDENLQLKQQVEQERERFVLDWKNRDGDRLVSVAKQNADEQAYYVREKYENQIGNAKAGYEELAKTIDEERRILAIENESIYKRNENLTKKLEELTKNFDTKVYEASSKIFHEKNLPTVRVLRWLVEKFARDLNATSGTLKLSFLGDLDTLLNKCFDQLGLKQADAVLPPKDLDSLTDLLDRAMKKERKKMTTADLRKFFRGLGKDDDSVDLSKLKPDPGANEEIATTSASHNAAPKNEVISPPPTLKLVDADECSKTSVEKKNEEHSPSQPTGISQPNDVEFMSSESDDEYELKTKNMDRQRSRPHALSEPEPTQDLLEGKLCSKESFTGYEEQDEPQDDIFFEHELDFDFAHDEVRSSKELDPAPVSVSNSGELNMDNSVEILLPDSAKDVNHEQPMQVSTENELWTIEPSTDANLKPANPLDSVPVLSIKDVGFDSGNVITATDLVPKTAESSHTSVSKQHCVQVDLVETEINHAMQAYSEIVHNGSYDENSFADASTASSGQTSMICTLPECEFGEQPMASLEDFSVVENEATRKTVADNTKDDGTCQETNEAVGLPTVLHDDLLLSDADDSEVEEAESDDESDSYNFTQEDDNDTDIGTLTDQQQQEVVEANVRRVGIISSKSSARKEHAISELRETQDKANLDHITLRNLLREPENSAASSNQGSKGNVNNRSEPSKSREDAKSSELSTATNTSSTKKAVRPLSQGSAINVQERVKTHPRNAPRNLKERIAAERGQIVAVNQVGKICQKLKYEQSMKSKATDGTTKSARTMRFNTGHLQNLLQPKDKVEKNVSYSSSSDVELLTLPKPSSTVSSGSSADDDAGAYSGLSKRRVAHVGVRASDTNPTAALVPYRPQRGASDTNPTAALVPYRPQRGPSNSAAAPKPVGGKNPKLKRLLQHRNGSGGKKTPMHHQPSLVNFKASSALPATADDPVTDEERRKPFQDQVRRRKQQFGASQAERHHQTQANSYLPGPAAGFHPQPSYYPPHPSYYPPQWMTGYPEMPMGTSSTGQQNPNRIGMPPQGAPPAQYMMPCMPNMAMYQQSLSGNFRYPPTPSSPEGMSSNRLMKRSTEDVSTRQPISHADGGYREEQQLNPYGDRNFMDWNREMYGPHTNNYMFPHPNYQNTQTGDRGQLLTVDTTQSMPQLGATVSGSRSSTPRQFVVPDVTQQIPQPRGVAATAVEKLKLAPVKPPGQKSGSQKSSREEIPAQSQNPQKRQEESPDATSSDSDELSDEAGNEISDVNTEYGGEMESPMSPQQELSDTVMSGNEDQTGQVVKYSKKKWRTVQSKEAFRINTWCRNVIGELMSVSKVDISKGSFNQINSKNSPAYRQISQQEKADFMDMAMARAIHEWMRTDPDEMFYSSGPVRPNVEKMIYLIEKWEAYLPQYLRSLHELLYEYFKTQVLANRLMAFKSDVHALDKLGRFYAQLCLHFGMKDKILDLILQALYSRPPHAFSLAKGILRIDFLGFTGVEFKSLDMKTKSILFCLGRAPRFSDSRGLLNLRDLLKKADVKTPDLSFEQFVLQIIDQVKKLESDKSLKEASVIISMLLMQRNPEETGAFISNLMTTLANDWRDCTISEAVFAAFIKAIGNVFRDSADTVSQNSLQILKKVLTILLDDKKVSDSDVLKPAIEYALRKLNERLQRLHVTWRWEYTHIATGRVGKQSKAKGSASAKLNKKKQKKAAKARKAQQFED